MTGGKVFLAGAGPGDPRLLTLRTAELLGRADVVVLDALVSPQIVSRIRKEAEIIYAGKRASAHTLTQSQINELLVQKARDGKLVVRLKGGDPFVFGRGGEEASALQAAGIPFEIVPGVSSSIAGPAYAGIPVTHRSLSTAFTVVTGHESDESSGVNWEHLAKLDGTVVFLMGAGNVTNIVERLIGHGKNPETPVAVISHATTPAQRTLTGRLDEIVIQVQQSAIETPALVVVGKVVGLRDTLAWFESRPLFGKTILVTRARAQASALSELLADQGAQVLEYPTIDIGPPDSYESLDGVVRNAASYDWLIFTSANGVRAFFERLFHAGRDARVLVNAQIAAVGEATAGELRSGGLVSDLIPPKAESKALLPLLPESLEGKRIAVIRAAKGRNELMEGLRARGAVVDLAVAYQTSSGGELSDEIHGLIRDRKLDCVTFTSSSTVENFFAVLSDSEGATLRNGDICLASIGPTTSETLAALGVVPGVEAAAASVATLCDAVVEWFKARKT